MCEKLELVGEEKLYRLLPGQQKNSRLEASGVALIDDRTALVVFDNLRQVARVELSLEPRKTNRFLPAPGLGTGFEDIAMDARGGRVFCLIEALEDGDGRFRGFVVECDVRGRFVRCTSLSPTVENENKGFEGLTHVRRRSREYLFALREGSPARRPGGEDAALTRSRRRSMAAGSFRAGSACRRRPGSRTTRRLPGATGASPSSRRRPRGCGWGGSTSTRAGWCPVRTPCTASRRRATATSRGLPGSPKTPWSRSPTGRRPASRRAVPGRTSRFTCSGFQRGNVKRETGNGRSGGPGKLRTGPTAPWPFL
jgi:hypothetical protein